MASENLAVTITGKGGDLIREFKKIAGEAETSGSKMHHAMSGAAKGIALAGGAIAGTLIAIGVASVHTADGFEKSHARLVTAITNTHGSLASLLPEVSRVDDRMANLGFTNTETESSLAVLTAASHSGRKALGLMALAANVARGRNIELSTATDILSKVVTGHVALLGRLGINTKDATGKTIDQETAVRRLSDMYGNQAAASADTFAGKQEVLKAKLHNLEVTIGQALIPILERLVRWFVDHVIPAVQHVVTWFQKHHDAAKAIAVVVAGVVVAAIVAYTASMAAAAAATIAATAPILAIIAVVAALALGAYELYKHWDQIWNWIKNSPAYPIISLLIQAVTDVIDKVKVAISWLRDNWPTIWDDIKSAIQPAADAIQAALGPVASMIDTINSGLNTMLGLVDQLPGVGGATNWNAPGGPGNRMGGHGAPGGTQPKPPSGNDWYAPGNPGYVPSHGGHGGHQARAHGGAVVPGMSYSVGEYGPETLVMGSSGGYVIPGSGAHGGNVYVTITGPVLGANAQYSRELAMAISNQLILHGLRGGVGLSR
jgi:hypothetical protein